MKARILLCGWMLAAAGGLAWGGETADKKLVVQATLELADGSRLVGTPLMAALSVKLDYAKVEVPLARIRQVEIRHKEEDVVVTLQNGDKLTGTLEMDKFPMETIIGKLVPTFDLINRMTFSVHREGALPAGEGPLAFGGVNWMPWRTLFEIQGDKLVSLPKARPGFNYGHSGNGRGATLVSNIGNADWRDYSVEFEYGMTGVDPALNPHGLPAGFRSGAIMFHVADAKESWNVRGRSSYVFSMGGDGSWGLSCGYNDYCQTPCGYGNPTGEGQRTLAEGKGLKNDPTTGNKIRIDVCGTRIQIRVDGEQIADVRDEKMGESIGGQTLDHGGIAIIWGFECMGWIRNFTAKQL